MKLQFSRRLLVLLVCLSLVGGAIFGYFKFYLNTSDSNGFPSDMLPSYINSSGGKVKCKVLNSTIVRMNSNNQFVPCRITPKTQDVTIPGLPVSNRLSMSVQTTDGAGCQRGLEFLLHTNNNSIVRVTRLKLEWQFKVPADNSLMQPVFVNLPNCANSNCTMTQDPQHSQTWRFSYEYNAPAGNFLEIRGIVNGTQTKLVFPMVLNSGCIDFYLITGEITTYTATPPGIDQAIDYILPTPVNQICATKITGYVTDVAGNLSNAKQNTTIISANSNVSSLYDRQGVWKDCGYFSFCVNPTGFPYTVKIPNNRTDVPLCGVTTYDLLLIRRHILGVELLPTAAQFIAADSDGNPSSTFIQVSSSDVLNFRNMILGASNTDKNWTYLNSTFNSGAANYNLETSTVYSSNFEPVTGQSDVAEFTAVKHGDVNLSCGCEFDQKAAPTAALEIQTKTTASQQIALPVRLLQADEPFAALQFALSIDTLLYKIVEIVPNKHLGIEKTHLSIHAQQKGEIRLAWYQADFETFLRNGDLLFTVYLQPISDTKRIENVEEIIQMSPTIEAVGYATNGLESYLNIRPVPSKDRFENITSRQWNVYLSPNPVGSNNHLRVSVETEEDSPIICNIVDTGGKTMHQITKKMQKGENQFYIDLSKLQSGVYFLTLTNTNGQQYAGRIVKL